jgi:hypothetical protein
MFPEAGPNDWRERKVQEWLLLLLRFAVTRHASDRLAVSAMADELDSLGELEWRPAAPSFFRRTSHQLTEAILGDRDATNSAVLRRHIARIDDLRLKRAFRAAVGLTSRPPPQSRRKASGLWTGLPRI